MGGSCLSQFYYTVFFLCWTNPFWGRALLKVSRNFYLYFSSDYFTRPSFSSASVFHFRLFETSYLGKLLFITRLVVIIIFLFENKVAGLFSLYIARLLRLWACAKSWGANRQIRYRSKWLARDLERYIYIKKYRKVFCIHCLHLQPFKLWYRLCIPICTCSLLLVSKLITIVSY